LILTYLKSRLSGASTRSWETKQLVGKRLSKFI
jgi:hypothetical protein